MPRILLVDDDRDLVDLMTFALKRAGFEVVTEVEPSSVTNLVRDNPPSLVVLDLNLGPHNGLDLLREIRLTTGLPVIILSARDKEDDVVAGLELGADDYLTKPFSHREIIARIRTILRRSGQTLAPEGRIEGPLEVGPIRLNAADHSVFVDGRPVDLSVTEFRLLHYLMVNAGTAVPLDVILRQVWGYRDTRDRDVVRVTLYRLRRKLEPDAGPPRLIQTLPGVGVLLTVPRAPNSAEGPGSDDPSPA